MTESSRAKSALGGRRLFVDMDGVLADFDSGYKHTFGIEVSKELDNVDWSRVRQQRDFYLNLPGMPDLPELWHYIHIYDPIILTGIPSSVAEAADNKRAWVRRYLGPVVEQRMICCPSKEKSLHCRSGDILIDDWVKYKSLWEAAGGTWITHVCAGSTISTLRGLNL